MIRRALISAGALIALCTPVMAVDLVVPAGAERTTERTSVEVRVAVPNGPYQDGFLPTRDAAGRKTVEAYRIAQKDVRAEALIVPLEAQLERAGFRVLLRCNTFDCGGFDFRFGIEVLPPPAMFVDLGEFSYVSAVSEGGDDFVMALASRTLDAGFLQITRVLPEGSPSGSVTTTGQTLGSTRGQQEPAITPGDVAATLDALGHAVLNDLSFATGTTDLSDGGYASLAALAGYLNANPTRRIALVGHTDASGGLDINLSVSKARAQAVRTRLIEAYGISSDRIEAEGVGYLSPKGSNLTEAGRNANRRVEAVVISTE